MLTKNEITSLGLSPTKKDFVQIWNELLEVSGKLSERWDPTSTNESDPGIVILKALAGIADKLNYNIDKNTLEAFMPTAAQEDSMRKLCEMLGYNIKYYQSATTNVTIKYHNPDPSAEEAETMAEGLAIPKFTVITNGDKDISYFTTNQTPYYISTAAPSKTLPCIEGQLVKCESISDNNVITIGQISESNRFYLPETQVAENGIFVYNITTDVNNTLVDGTAWEKVDNLNIQVNGSRVFKFGFDSYEGRPYIEFPNDYSELFNDGIFIYYTRTNGINGNVSARTLTQLELPSEWGEISAESFSVENTFSATSGSNIETIEQAYNNFKKTVGTFETLVTCRDYMNKIYSMVKESNGKPYVSNILVTDIRNDLNRAVTICSCDDAGIFYKETPLVIGTTENGEPSKGVTDTVTTYTEYEQVGEPKYSPYVQDGDPEYTEYEQEGETEYTDYVLSGDDPTYTEYEQVGEIEYTDYALSGDEPTYTDYAQVGETEYTEYKPSGDAPTYTDYEQVGEPEFTDYTPVGNPEYSDYKQVGEPEYSEYEQEGAPEYSEYAQVGDAKYSESTTTEVSDPEQLSKDEQFTYVASEANKPRIATTVKISQYYDYNNEEGPIMGTRYTCWYLGSENSDYRIYLYADGFGSDWIPTEFVNPDIFFPAASDDYFKSAPSIAGYDENEQPIFEDIDLGFATATTSSGERSDFWLIVQGDKVFETLLPIDWVKSTNTTIVNQQTKTITKNITETIEKQRTETIKKQRTATVKEQRTETINQQRTKTVKEQRTETVKEQRDAIINRQRTETVKEQRDAIIRKQRTETVKEQRDAVIKKKRTETINKQRTGTIEKQRDRIINNSVVNTQEVIEDRAINHFDIVFYPFKQYNQIKSSVLNDDDIRSVYDSSFTYTSDNIVDIKNELEVDTIKTISHNVLTPRERDGILGEGKLGDLVSINNYLRLNATIATNSKVTTEESEIIINKIKVALANAFNMRELDFGEEIPFDSIVKVIENADSRIRVASLTEPDLYTTFSVLTGKDNKGLKVTEYAVASGWLNDEAASSTGRFVDPDGNDTFDTREAKEIYNRLAVRNLLAGRVSLFKYNSTFKTSFTEGAYQVTDVIVNKPEGLLTPTFESPYTIWTDSTKTYVGQLENLTEKPEILAEATVDAPTTSVVDENAKVTYISKWDAVEHKAIFAKITYSEVYTPDDYKGNIITADKAGNNITDISTSCKIKATVDEITDVSLANGEFIKFRAPNFTTVKTYPAYVNYHFQRNKALLAEAVPANASSLFTILDSDRSSWAVDSKNIKWQKVLDYFGSLDTAIGIVDPKDKNAHKKVLTVEQTISAYKPAASTGEDTCTNESGHVKGSDGVCIYCGKTILDGVQTGPIKVEIASSVNENRSFEDVFAKGGCVKLANTNFKARLYWAPEAGEKAPAYSVPIDIELNLDNPFITNSTIISNLKEAVETALSERVGMTNSDGSPVLPTECTWKAAFDFEYVPFEARTLPKWEEFIRACIENFDNNYKYQIFDFKPVEDNTTILWRMFGEGYDIGKYVTADTEKLLKFDANYFGLLPEVYLKGIYVAENIGVDANPAIIQNDEEYRLRANEYLYIEYTPSSTSEDGTTKGLAAVTEIHGEGTIIRPSGFEAGLIDSTILSREATPHKDVVFITENSTSSKVAMHRLGANEQIEIRDFAKVELTKDSFKTSPTVYVYKNFNNCPELEEFNTNSSGQRINNSYTLKDGEYIFYTDQNKSEFAYFASGTQVTLDGSLVLQQYDIHEIADIFDMSVADIPWKYISFTNNDKITFQEFQYVTLGPEDTLKNLRLVNISNNENYLSDRWQYCSDVLYSVASDPDTTVSLPAINIYNGSRGNGWEACSIFELDVSSSYAQTLRNDDKVQTSLTLFGAEDGGAKDKPNKLVIEPSNSEVGLSFKTNLTCSAAGNHINIDDVYYNPDKLKGFQLKIFQEETPAIVETAPGKVVPYQLTGSSSITNWAGEPLAPKSQSELWHQISLEKLKSKIINEDNEEIVKYDNALRLVTNIIPRTYGVFCIYLNYTNDEAARTWIEVLPGTDHADITLVNAKDDEIVWETPVNNNGEADKLFLRPGINCIRVNKTGRIFIKTSSRSQGMLYFDELRLVDCLPIEYTDENNIKHTIATQGLNLEQLGYLSTAEMTNGVSQDMRNKLNTVSVEEAYVSLEVEANKAKQTFNNLYSDLQDIKTKLQKMVSFAKNAKSEFKTFSERYTDDADTKKLFEKYYEISTALSQEKALLDALDNKDNKTISELEQQLANLLEDFSNIEAVQQQLWAELDALKDKTLASVNDLSDAAVLNDYKSASTADKTAVQNDIALEHKKNVMAQYNSKLSALASEAEKILSTGDHRALLTVLDSKREDPEQVTRMQLLADINQLVNAIDRTAIDTQLDAAYNFAASGANKELINALSQLRELLINSEIKTYVTKIEAAAAESNDAYLNSLVGSLVTILGSTYNTASSAAASDKYDQTIKRIDSLITSARGYVNDSSVIASLVTGVNDIRTSLSSSYNKQIKKLSETIEDYLEDLVAEEDSDNNPTVSAAVSSLKLSENTQVSYILTELSNLTTQRDADLGSSDYSDAAIVTVWTQHLRQQLTTSIETTYTSLYEAIKEPKEVTISINFGSSLFGSYVNAFTALAARVNTLAKQNSASSENITLVSDIGKDLFSMAPDVTSAMSAITNDTSGRKAVIADLIGQLTTTDTDTTKSPSVTEKQQLLKKLREELENAKQVDEQLFNIVANLLIPSISLYESSSDAFYDKLTVLIDGKEATDDTERIEGLKDLILVSSAEYDSNIANIRSELNSKFGATSTFMSQDVALLDQLNGDSIISWLANLDLDDFKENSYLPDSYLNKISDLKDSITLQAEIDVLKEKDLFKQDFFFTADYTEKTAAKLVTEQFTEADLLKNKTTILPDLLVKIENTERLDSVTDEFRKAYIISETEKQLLEDIRRIDVHRDFYYNAPVETSLAIEFNKSNAELNTLMNPLMNYDINNVNNSFVISKLDIDYLTTGIQIARSSRLN